MSEYEMELLGVLYEAKARVNDIEEAAALAKLNPSILLRPRIFADGDQWCALYGDNIQDGVAAFGETPAKAFIQFDIEWLNARAHKETK